MNLLYSETNFTDNNVDVTGNESKNATLLSIVYNNIVYESLQSFRLAWSSPGFKKLPMAEDGEWTKPDREGEPFPFDSEPGPVQINTNQRYAIDTQNQYIEWMGFSFYLAMSSEVGLTLYNVNYDGERIIYELGKMSSKCLLLSQTKLSRNARSNCTLCLK